MTENAEVDLEVSCPDACVAVPQILLKEDTPSPLPEPKVPWSVHQKDVCPGMFNVPLTSSVLLLLLLLSSVARKQNF